MYTYTVDLPNPVTTTPHRSTVEPMSDLESTEPVPSIVAGWYPDPQNPALVRYHDGLSWTEHREPAAQQVAPPQVVVNGPYTSVAKVPRKTSHTFHLLMTVFTCGLWGLFVWGPVSLYNSMRKDKVVTRYQ